ncbi:SIS domain-containing protein [Allosalinactinospora lopnorensis]|uniref:SIS domain-containing protein n=1 Tax=Allosalinactinospora lopnorensis TaxID=1352348 RepID=UPI000623D55B|nr:SIS domain-containing protein [Allosalinactinospora lopnorensis]
MALVFEERRLDDLSADADALRGVASAAARVRSARSAAREAGLGVLGDEGRPRSIVVAGSGAAALAGDVLEAVLGVGCPIPIHTVRDYRLPGWVSGHDLVAVVASTSGHDAQAAVPFAAEAVRRGCRFLVASPAGSPLAPYAEQARSPFVALPPAGHHLEMPWGVAGALLAAASEVGLAPITDDVYEGAAVRLEQMAERCRPGAESWDNPAKLLALDLAGTLPAIWSAAPLTAAVAARFATSLAVNARYPALCGRFPGALQDQFATVDGPFGGTGPRSIFDDPVEDDGTRLLAVLLRDPGEPPEAAEEMDSAAEGARERGVHVRELAAEDGHVLERLAGLIALTDYASVYLAVAYGIDP